LYLVRNRGYTLSKLGQAMVILRRSGEDHRRTSIKIVHAVSVEILRDAKGAPLRMTVRDAV